MGTTLSPRRLTIAAITLFLAMVGVYGDVALPSFGTGLVDDLHSSDPANRARAAYTLGETQDTKALKPLIQALEDPSSEVRSAAAWSLRFLNDNSSVDPLIHALDDENSTVRSYAALTLGILGDARAIEPLNAALSDNSSLVRESAAISLGKLNDTPPGKKDTGASQVQPGFECTAMICSTLFAALLYSARKRGL